MNLHFLNVCMTCFETQFCRLLSVNLHTNSVRPNSSRSYYFHLWRIGSYSSQMGKIESYSSHVSNIYVTAPGKFVIEAGCLCTMKSHSSKLKIVNIYNWVTFVTHCYCQYFIADILLYKIVDYVDIVLLCCCWCTHFIWLYICCLPLGLPPALHSGFPLAFP